jgi:hypothetical protein
MRTYAQYPKWITPHASWIRDGGHAAMIAADQDAVRGFTIRSVDLREHLTTAYMFLVPDARAEAKYTSPRPP